MHLQMNALTDCKDDMLLVCHSALALAFSLAMDSEEKWKILSLNGGALYLLMN